MKKNLFVISESEKERILGMHKQSTQKQYLSEQMYYRGQDGKVGIVKPPMVAPAGSTPISKEVYDTESKVTAPATPAPATPAPATPAPVSNNMGLIELHDSDYDYKKDGEKYYFKIKTNAKTPSVKQLLSQGKYKDWTLATGKGLEAIKKLNWASGDKVSAQPQLTSVQRSDLQTPVATVSGGTPTVSGGTPTVSGGGGTPEIKLGAIGDAEKSMPKIKTLDPAKQSQVAAWSQTPAGKYIISLPANQREAALNNLEKRSGDQQTRDIKNEIRIALGMQADTAFGRLRQGVQGAVQGYKQGVQGNVPPQQ